MVEHPNKLPTASEFQIDFKSQLSKDLLILLVEFLNAQLNFTPQEFRNSKSDTTGNTLCDVLDRRAFINSFENIKTKFRDLLSKVNEDGNRFALLRNLNAWLEHWIAKPGFQSKNQTEMAANVESRLFVLMEHNLEQAKENLRGFLHPLCSDRIDEKVENHKLVLEKVLEFLNDKNPRKKVLLILGNAGSGKSSCCQMILRLLWAKFNSTEIGEGEIPLFASLPTIPNPSENVVSETLRRAGTVDQNDQLWLKEKRIVHFILDGYDELFGQVDLFSQSTLASFNGKIIISCRNESLPDLALLSPQNSEITKIHLTPFTEKQRTEFVKNQSKKEEDVFDFNRFIRTIPSLKEFIHTPFHLKIILEILPQIEINLKQTGQNLNRFEIYDLFIRNRINQAIQNHVGPLQHLKTLKLNSKQIPNAVFRQCIEWSIQMRNQKSTNLSFDISSLEIDKELQSLAGMETKEQILKWLSPLLLEENGNIVNCRFIHSTIGEFFFVLGLTQMLTSTKSSTELRIEIKKHPIFSQLLGLSTWQFISDLVHSNENLKHKIWYFIEFSKESEELSIVAANCASIWNVANLSFSRKDLRNIKIPGAYLNRSNFYGIDLRNSNLKGCKLKDAVLIEANFEGADMSEVLFGESSIWKLRYEIYHFQAMLHENCLIIDSYSTGFEIWDYETQTLRFTLPKGDVYSTFFLKNILITQTYMGKIKIWDLQSGHNISTFKRYFGDLTFNLNETLMLEIQQTFVTLWNITDLKNFKLIWTKSFKRYPYSYFVDFSPNHQMVSVINGNECYVWSTINDEEIFTFSSPNLLKQPFFSQNNQLLFFVNATNMYSLNLISKSLSSPIVFLENEFESSGFVKIPNRNEIFFTSQQPRGSCILDLDSGEMFEIESEIHDFKRYLFSEDFSLLAILTGKPTLLCLIDLKQRKVLHFMKYPSFEGKFLRVTNDFITIQENNVIKSVRWKAEEGHLVPSSIAPTRHQLHLFEDDGLLFRLSNYDWNVSFWDLKSKRISFFETDRYFTHCRCGSSLIFSDKNILIEKFGKLSFQLVPSSNSQQIEAMSSNGSQVLVIFKDKLKRKWVIYDTSTWAILSEFEQQLQSNHELLEEKRVLLGKKLIIEKKEDFVLFSNFNGDQTFSIQIGYTKVEDLFEISPDFNLLFMSSDNQSQILNIETGIVELMTNLEPISAICWNSSCQYLVIAVSKDFVNIKHSLIEIWDWPKRTLKKSFKVAVGVKSICASKDFSQIFIGTIHGSIWNFKIIGLESKEISLELIWVFEPKFIAINANLKRTKISREDRLLLEHYGAIKQPEDPKLTNEQNSKQESKIWKFERTSFKTNPSQK